MTEEIKEALEDNDIEAQAITQGWNPNYEGPGKKTAEQFVEDGKKIAPIQAERNDKLTREVMELRQKIDAMQRATFESIQDARESAYKEALEKLEAQELEAVEEGDTERFREVKRKKEELKPPKTEAPNAETASPPPPEFVEWQGKNDWYGKDPGLTQRADEIFHNIKSYYGPGQEAEVLEEIGRRVKNEYPDKFETKKVVPDVEAPGGGGAKATAKAAKTINDLPKEYQNAFKKQSAAYGISEKEYINQYNDFINKK